MQVRIAEPRLVEHRPLEPDVAVEVPGETDAAVDLDCGVADFTSRILLPNNDDGDLTYYKRRSSSETLPADLAALRASRFCW